MSRRRARDEKTLVKEVKGISFFKIFTFLVVVVVSWTLWQRLRGSSKQRGRDPGSQGLDLLLCAYIVDRLAKARNTLMKSTLKSPRN